MWTVTVRIVCSGDCGCKHLVGGPWPGSLACGVFRVGRARRALKGALGILVWTFVLQSLSMDVVATLFAVSKRLMQKGRKFNSDS